MTQSVQKQQKRKINFIFYSTWDIQLCLQGAFFIWVVFIPVSIMAFLFELCAYKMKKSKEPWNQIVVSQIIYCDLCLWHLISQFWNMTEFEHWILYDICCHSLCTFRKYTKQRLSGHHLSLLKHLSSTIKAFP